MTIATEKIKNSSERFMLVRMEPARYIEPVSQGGGVYEQSAFPYVVSRIQRNGTDLTEVTTLANNDEYTWDESTGDIQIKLASAPDPDDNVIVVFYYLFFTGSINRAISEDPTDDTTPLREWKARIESYPAFYQSFNNIENGIMTIADSTLKLLNPDREFQLCLTDDDSFYNKRVEIWGVINDISNIQKLYDGTITDLSLSGINVTISIVDKFQKLKQMAYMGDSEREAIFTRETGSFPNMHPASSGKPCPYIVSDKSAFKTAAFDVEPGVRLPIIIDATRAVCTDFSDNKVVTENREWGLCRTLNAISTQGNVTGLITSVVQQGTSAIYRLNLSSGSTSFTIGDTFKYTQSSVDYYALVTDVQSSYIHITPISDLVAPLTSLTHTPLPSMGVTISGLPFDENAFFIGTMAIPLYEYDYTLTSSATSGGNDYHYITFNNDFEANFNGPYGNPFGPTIFVLDPDVHEVKFRITTTVQAIGRELGRIISKAGIERDNSFTTIEDTTLFTMRPSFQIPNIDEETYDFYLKYVQDLLATMLCYLKINVDGEASVGPLIPPSSSDTRDSSLLLNGTVSARVDYNDIVTDLIAYNPHLDSGDPNAFAYSTTENNKARYLHEINNTDRFKHCAERLTDRSTADYLSLKSQRKVRYTYDVATEDIDTELGDDILLDNKIVVGTSESRSVKVTGINKSSDRITIEASDLLGITDT